MGAHRKDYAFAVILYESGFSIGDAASYYGITRQAMHKILKRRDVVFRPQLRYGRENHFWRGGVLKKGVANDLVERALEKGIITRPDVCDECGNGGEFRDGRTVIQSHHSDYNKPLDVEWLCQKCHHEKHKTERAIGIDE